jgi:hypothetical protein
LAGLFFCFRFVPETKGVAVQVFRRVDIDKLPGFRKRLAWYLANKPKLAEHISNRKSTDAHYQDIALLAIPTADHLKRVLRYMLDEC